MRPNVVAGSEQAFQDLWDSVAATRVDLAARFPAWPFRAARGCATIFEYDSILSGGFGAVLDALVGTYGHAAVTVVGVDPPAEYYRDEFGFFPALHFSRARVRDGYGDASWYDPGGDPMACLEISLNVIAIAGSSGAWAVWGQRDWEIGLLLTPERDGPWLDADVVWFGTDVDLDSIRSLPAGDAPERGGP